MPLSKSSAGLMIFAITCICLATIIGLTLHFTIREMEEPRTDAVVDCHPDEEPNKDDCESRGCKWQRNSEGGPSCTFKSGMGYEVNGQITETEKGLSGSLVLLNNAKNPFGDANFEEIKFLVEYQSDDRVHLKIYKDGVYEVPTEALEITNPDRATTNRLYDISVETDGDDFGFKITRRSTNATIFDTTLPGLQFGEQFIQITSRLNSSKVYGFGEHNHKQLLHDMAFKTWGMFTRDVAPIDPWNLYGHQTFYMNLETTNDANGVVLINSNAMEVALQPDPYPAITYRALGGVLDFYIFLGPSPEQVVQQYTEATGRPIMPPYWALGFQLSRWDYSNISHVQNVVRRNIDAGIPLDVQYGDIDYMESKLDFTYDKVNYNGLPEFVDDLHALGIKYIVIQDHCIGSNQTVFDDKLNGFYKPYHDGLEQDIFIRDTFDNTKYLEGEVWPGVVYYPDFTKLDAATRWWKDQCHYFYYNDTWRIEFDALWIDMNEPSNFIDGQNAVGTCAESNLNSPAYLPQSILGTNLGILYEKTICMNAVQAWGNHYDVHSLYGHSMSIVSYETMRQIWPTKRPLVLTRSQFIGSQKYAAHWLGDNQSFWEQIPWSIVAMLEYSLFGFSYTGADICGFWEETTEEMCQRWMQLGAFYPFSRNHNGQGFSDQDPGSPMFSDELRRVSRDVLLTRYKLLPYLYTLMYKAHTTGSTVARPLFHEFVEDSTTHSIDTQFLWGPAFMVSPAMSVGQTEVRAYVPQGPWYDYYTGEEITAKTWHVFNTPLDKINLHVRGGYILPWQEPANNTHFSRNNPMGLLVALGPAPNYEASGSLFWDDGETFDSHSSTDEYYLGKFSCRRTIDFTCDLVAEHSTYAGAALLEFDEINVFGVEREPRDIVVDGVTITSYEFDQTYQKLTLRSLGLNITVSHTITWSLSN